MEFCSKCLVQVKDKDKKAIAIIKQEYLKDDSPWFLGYSGGKDSSALLKLVLTALIEIKIYHKVIKVVYCDTGVENPIITTYVYQTFSKLKEECAYYSLPIEFLVAKPELEDRFFVKVIGRGYPTPTNIFRWCTDKLRINPVKKIINENPNAIVLLGIRKGESEQRDRTIRKHATNSDSYLTHAGSSTKLIFSPVINHSLKDIWSTLQFNNFPKSINVEILGMLYKDAGSECPVYRELPGQACGNSRFGCWTCTVVRKDKSISSMISNGYGQLKFLHDFRNWIAEFRDNKDYRCQIRRNGQIGLGPFTMEGRRIILTKLKETEFKSGLKLIDNDEIKRIHELWQRDISNPHYKEKIGS